MMWDIQLFGEATMHRFGYQTAVRSNALYSMTQREEIVERHKRELEQQRDNDRDELHTLTDLNNQLESDLLSAETALSEAKARCVELLGDKHNVHAQISWAPVVVPCPRICVQ